MTILIYSDQGTGPRSVRLLVKSLKSENLDRQFTIKRVDSRFLKLENWEPETRLLIFPGGRDTLYHQALQGYANQKIRDYIEKGGAYLGICAGGYFGCAHVEFEKGHPLEIIAQRELKFFPGTARGPVYGPNRFRYENESGSCIAELLWEGDDKLESASVYFNGGCEFVEAETYSNTQVLARYRNIPHAPAAIVECQIGLGKAILSGVHPEYRALDLANQASLFDQALSRFKEKEALFTISSQKAAKRKDTAVTDRGKDTTSVISEERSVTSGLSDEIVKIAEKEDSRQKLFRSLLNRVLIQKKGGHDAFTS